MDLNVIDHLLMTTRSVRKRLDLTRPVEPEVIERCLEIAMQAPSGSDRQRWHFVVITDLELRRQVAELYQRSFDEYIRPQMAAAGEGRGTRRDVLDSAVYLADHFHEVPVQVLFCYEGRAEHGSVMSQAGLYGSILPAAWSFMLALRSRGLGSAWTTLHLRYERETAALLDLPNTLTQAALIPVAYTTGDFRPAKRKPLAEVSHWNGWNGRREE